MAAIAEREGLNTSRVGQICLATCRKYGVERGFMTKQQIGARLANSPVHVWSSRETPEGFYQEVEHERRFQNWAGRPVVDYED